MSAEAVAYGTLGSTSLPLERKQVRWSKALAITLIILGVGGLAAACVGISSLGVYQKWWSFGGLSRLSQIDSIAMTAAGGGVGIVCLIPGIMIPMKDIQGTSEARKSDKSFRYAVDTLTGIEIEVAESGLHTCFLFFTNCQKLRVSLTPQEVGNFVKLLGENRVIDKTTLTWGTTDTSGSQVEEILKVLND